MLRKSFHYLMNVGEAVRVNKREDGARLFNTLHVMFFEKGVTLTHS